jgi:hypothetical protein
VRFHQLNQEGGAPGLRARFVYCRVEGATGMEKAGGRLVPFPRYRNLSAYRPARADGSVGTAPDLPRNCSSPISVGAVTSGAAPALPPLAGCRKTSTAPIPPGQGGCVNRRKQAQAMVRSSP